MQCSGCQQENPSQARFCLACGRRLTLQCEQCGTVLPGGARFCIHCGQPVTTRPVVDSPFTSLEAHTPRHLAEKILGSRSSLAGQRKPVTVLFADLRGSMELFADRDPEEARKLLDPVLEGMIEAVHRYEGIVTQVVGDGTMAMFGAPLPHEDHAVRGCYAALRMQETVARYAEDLRRSQALDVQIRVGMHSGEVLVHSIGSDLRLDYVAVGQTVHLALRMAQLARPGTTLVTGDTRRLAEGFVECRRLDRMPVPGTGEPIEVF